VIQGYLNGKTRDLISKEIGISAGGVSNIIREWKRGIKLPEIDALRDFAKRVEKSDISIAQCAQGYRIIQLMKDLGISDDSELDGYTDSNNNGNSSIRSDSDINTIYKKMDFPTFVKEIYSNCKNLGIPPTIIP
jgi:hypothetical protein